MHNLVLEVIFIVAPVHMLTLFDCTVYKEDNICMTANDCFINKLSAISTLFHSEVSYGLVKVILNPNLQR